MGRLLQRILLNLFLNMRDRKIPYISRPFSKYLEIRSKIIDIQTGRELVGADRYGNKYYQYYSKSTGLPSSRMIKYNLFENHYFINCPHFNSWLHQRAALPPSQEELEILYLNDDARYERIKSYEEKQKIIESKTEKERFLRNLQNLDHQENVTLHKFNYKELKLMKEIQNEDELKNISVTNSKKNIKGYLMEISSEKSILDREIAKPNKQELLSEEYKKKLKEKSNLIENTLKKYNFKFKSWDPFGSLSKEESFQIKDVGVKEKFLNFEDAIKTPK